MTFTNLIDTLKNEEFIFIQTHNYPDHDAVATAFALQHFLEHFNIKSCLIYDGEIQRDSLLQMIEDLGITIKNHHDYPLTSKHKIIIVDGCKWNKNVTDLIGDEVGVIDHHIVESPDDVPFVDIRPNYGSCSSILYSYYIEYNVEIPKNVATALMVGINMDTSLLTRGVSKSDIEAYASLYTISDIRLQNSILRNYIQTKDLSFYRYVIDKVKIEHEIAYCYFPDGCNQNLLAILGDFLLALEEVEFVILCAKNKESINFSLRSEKKEWNAALVLQEVLKGIGFGGGHADMAGGIINDISLFNPEDMHIKFLSHLSQTDYAVQLDKQ
jgi:nanoRNase/pAp phosphatase (c-di-AMP/oligoRNAs hydrolase)